MTTPHKALEEAEGRHETIEHRRDVLVPFASAVIAVLAALGSLFAHHRSIQTLTVKNEAILTAAKASDRYAYYETKLVRVGFANALLAADLPADSKSRAVLEKMRDHESRSSDAVLVDAKALEERSAGEQEQSEFLMKSFETLEVATTLFEVSIIFASISALSRTRPLLWVGIGMSGLGVIIAIYGYLQAH